MAYLHFKKRDGTWYLIDKKAAKPWQLLGAITRAEAKDRLLRYKTDLTYLRLDMPLPPSDITLTELVDEYVHNIKYSKASYTVKLEGERLRSFCNIKRAADEGLEFFKGVPQKRKKGAKEEILKVGDLFIHELSPEAVKNFLFVKRYKANTSRLIILSLRGIYKLAVERKYVPRNPILEIPLPKLEKLPPRHVDPQAIKTVFAFMKGEALAFYTILHYAGMRPGEALRLQVKDILEGKPQRILIRYTKTKRFRIVPISSKLKKTIAELTKGKGAEDFLFPGKKAGSHRTGMKRGLENALKLSGVKEKIFPYAFRHTFGTQVLHKGGNLRVAQELMGHESSKMTERYASPLTQDMIDAVESLE